MRNAIRHGVMTGNGLKSALASVFAYASFPLHGDSVGTDAATAITDDNPESALSSLDVAGATGGIWASAGSITPATNGYVSPAGGSALFTPGKDGAILVAGQIKVTGDPSVDNYLLDCGSGDTTLGGGVGVRMQTNGNLNIVVRAPKGGGAFAGAGKDLSAQANTWVSFLFYVDVLTDNVTSYFDGTEWTNAPMGLAAAPVPVETFGLQLFCRKTAASTRADFAGLGANGTQLRNVWIINDKGRQLHSKAPSVALDLHTTPWELPAVLRRIARSAL